jgi:hypothetical protein
MTGTSEDGTFEPSAWIAQMVSGYVERPTASHRERPSDGTGGRIRTLDALGWSQPLWPLSYTGMVGPWGPGSNRRPPDPQWGAFAN